MAQVGAFANNTEQTSEASPWLVCSMYNSAGTGSPCNVSFTTGSGAENHGPFNILNGDQFVFTPALAVTGSDTYIVNDDAAEIEVAALSIAGQSCILLPPAFGSSPFTANFVFTDGRGTPSTMTFTLVCMVVVDGLPTISTLPAGVSINVGASVLTTASPTATVAFSATAAISINTEPGGNFFIAVAFA